MTSRRHVHTRSIRAEAFVRDDGLWDLEAELVDTKSRDFKLASGMRPAGSAIHRMRVTITIDTRFSIVDAQARSLDHPYPGRCAGIEPDYRKLVGLNLMKDFKRSVRQRLGGIAGCTHMTELTDVLPTAAVQAFAGESVRNRDGADHRVAGESGAAVTDKPFQLDRCHALRSDGPAVAEFYPRWSRPAAESQESSDSTAERHP
jgi:hypothetical protein